MFSLGSYVVKSEVLCQIEYVCQIKCQIGCQIFYHIEGQIVKGLIVFKCFFQIIEFIGFLFL